jgi:hypothetical protein
MTIQRKIDFLRVRQSLVHRIFNLPGIVPGENAADAVFSRELSAA